MKVPGRWSGRLGRCRGIHGCGGGTAVMVRVFALLGLVVLAGCGCETDRQPYVWPTPAYGVSWEATSFTLRYSEWWNTEDEVRKAVAEACGARFDVARVYPVAGEGSAMHPQSLRVFCGPAPAPVSMFRGQTVAESYLMTFKAGP